VNTMDVFIPSIIPSVVFVSFLLQNLPELVKLLRLHLARKPRFWMSS